MGTRHSLGPSISQPSSFTPFPATSASTTARGTNRAPFQRTFEDADGGHRFPGGATNKVSPWKGKQELKRTAGDAARAVASSQASPSPSNNMADVTAEYSESLCRMRSTRSRSPESGPMRQGLLGLRRMRSPEGMVLVREPSSEVRSVDQRLHSG